MAKSKGGRQPTVWYESFRTRGKTRQYKCTRLDGKVTRETVDGHQIPHYRGPSLKAFQRAVRRNGALFLGVDNASVSDPLAILALRPGSRKFTLGVAESQPAASGNTN